MRIKRAKRRYFLHQCLMLMFDVTTTLRFWDTRTKVGIKGIKVHDTEQIQNANTAHRAAVAEKMSAKTWIKYGV